MRKPNGKAEPWLVGVRKAFIREGASLRKAARVVSEAMDAQYVEVAKHEGQITDERSYVDHQTRLKAACTVTEIFAPRTAGGGAGEGRFMLNVQAGAKVQLLYFGDVIGELPEAQGATVTIPVEPVSQEMKQALVRQGKALPSGETVKAPEAKPEPTTLPEGTPKGEGWLK